MVYDRIPGVDSAGNFPPAVVNALRNSPEFASLIGGTNYYKGDATDADTLNDIGDAGLWYATATAKGLPTADFYYILVYAAVGSGSRIQKAIQYGTNVEPREYIRTLSSDVWSPWTRIDVGVHTDSGTVVNVGGVRAFGDTGYRELTPESTWEKDDQYGRLTIRRVNNMVELEGRLRAKDVVGARRNVISKIADIPTGFRPKIHPGTSFVSGNVYGLSGTITQGAQGVVHLVSTGSSAISARVQMSLDTTDPWAEDDRILCYTSFMTNDAWPTTLPGTPT